MSIVVDPEQPIEDLSENEAFADMDEEVTDSTDSLEAEEAALEDMEEDIVTEVPNKFKDKDLNDVISSYNFSIIQ